MKILQCMNLATFSYDGLLPAVLSTRNQYTSEMFSNYPNAGMKVASAPGLAQPSR